MWFQRCLHHHPGHIHPVLQNESKTFESSYVHFNVDDDDEDEEDIREEIQEPQRPIRRNTTKKNQRVIRPGQIRMKNYSFVV